MKESSDTPGGEITRIVARIQDLKVDKIADDLDARLELLRLSRKLTAVLEGPVDRATDLVFKPYMSIAARVAVDIGLFEHISAKYGPVSSQELATLTKADSLLI